MNRTIASLVLVISSVAVSSTTFGEHRTPDSPQLAGPVLRPQLNAGQQLAGPVLRPQLNAGQQLAGPVLRPQLTDSHVA